MLVPGRVVSLECEIQLEETEMVLDDEPLQPKRARLQNASASAVSKGSQLGEAKGSIGSPCCSQQLVLLQGIWGEGLMNLTASTPLPAVVF